MGNVCNRVFEFILSILLCSKSSYCARPRVAYISRESSPSDSTLTILERAAFKFSSNVSNVKRTGMRLSPCYDGYYQYLAIPI